MPVIPGRFNTLDAVTPIPNVVPGAMDAKTVAELYSEGYVLRIDCTCGNRYTLKLDTLVQERPYLTFKELNARAVCRCRKRLTLKLERGLLSRLS